MLASNRCDRLDTLQLDLFGADCASALFHELKYAPVLQQLSLRSVAIRLENLEIIHENAPSLEALKLEWIYIKRGNSYPSNIVSATCLTTIHFTADGASDLDTHTALYKYSNQKYVNRVDTKHKDAKGYKYLGHDRKRFYAKGYLGF